MNLSGSECSSGCQSGWTEYLDQNSNSTDQWNNNNRVVGNSNRQRSNKFGIRGDDEDLSMVSDASSGPPHFREYDNDYCSYYFAEDNNKGKKKKKSKEYWCDDDDKKQSFYCLEDTASSPALSFPYYKENATSFLDETTSMQNVPAGASETHLKGNKSVFGFLKSSVSGKKAASLKSGSMKGRK